MAKLRDKIDNSFDEALILITATEVVLGFQFRAIFENGFDSLPADSRLLKVGGLALLLGVLSLLLTPAAYHHLVTLGDDSEDLYRFTTMALALVPFALALGIDVYVVAGKVQGPGAGIGAAVAVIVVALGLWYALALIDKQRGVDRMERKRMKVDAQPRLQGESEKLEDKVKQVLQEARMVIPGAQALLGFQFVVVLTDVFDKLPEALKYVHLFSLGMIALSLILLMTPASYHRIVEEGEDTQHFYGVASRLVIAAMVPLALGMAGDFYLVVLKVVQSQPAALAAALAALCMFYGCWFGFTLYRRSRPPSKARAEQMQAAR